MTPGTWPLTVYRNAPFVETIAEFEAIDFTGATFAMQVRDYRDAEGAALIDLAGATAGTQGISCAVTTDGDGVPTSFVTVQIDKATIDATRPWPANGQKANTDVKLFYDLKITGGGYPETRWLQGLFTIEAGVTE
jgi:hypothetical protein